MVSYLGGTIQGSLSTTRKCLLAIKPEEEPHKMFINGKYLKNYFPTTWEMLDTTKKN